jgi:hypothetical protein
MLINPGCGLQPKRGFATAFFAKNDRRGRLERTTQKFIPFRVMHMLQAFSLKNQICLSILFTERIRCNPMILQVLINFHGLTSSRPNRLDPLTQTTLDTQKPGLFF